jgi:DNA-binding NtrC family response regulator
MSIQPKAGGKPGLLLVDDDPLIAESLRFVLSEEFDVTVVMSRADAKTYLASADSMPELALVDLGLPPTPHRPDEGLALINELPAFNPHVKTLVLSGQDEAENAQQALARGAVDFIAKPCDVALLKARLQHQLKINQAEVAEPSPEARCGLVGSCSAMELLKAQIGQLASSPFPILIQGDSGTGKELVAECLHAFSDRREQPCLTVNCAAFNAELLEAQLFGHVRGAFTGATEARKGFFEEVGEGTLFLDEIGELPLGLQSKLLRILENGEFYRLGETMPRLSRARIVAATNSDLRQGIREGRFREDLYHRLSVLNLFVPPLRERGEDRLELLEYFRELYARAVAPFKLNEEATAIWMSYDFPGNVRELRNIVIRLGAKYPGQEVGARALQSELQSQEGIAFNIDDSAVMSLSPTAIEQDLHSGSFNLDDKLSEIEEAYIETALSACNGNFSQAARMLGVNRTTLYSRLSKRGKGSLDHV